MKTFIGHGLAAVILGLAITAAPAAMAGEAKAKPQQFILKLAQPLAGGDDVLRFNLGICEVDAFERDGAHYVVLKAKDEGYVEAFLFAKHIDAEEIGTLPVDWTGRAMKTLPIARRIAFAEPIARNTREN